jgi:putative membrane protein
VNRETQGVVLLLVGGSVLYAGLTDLHLRYVKAGLRPLLLIAAVVLIAAGVATLWRELRNRRARRPQGDDHHHEPRVSWLLMLPVFALILAAPPALGSYAAGRTGTGIQEPAGFADLPADDPVRLSVLDYATRAVYDHGQSLRGRRVRLVGFLMTGPNGTPMLTRMFLSCCAADAQPIKVGLTGHTPVGMKTDTWIEVVGTYTTTQLKDSVNGRPIPFLEVDTVTPVAPPRERYEV